MGWNAPDRKREMETVKAGKRGLMNVGDNRELRVVRRQSSELKR